MKRFEPGFTGTPNHIQEAISRLRISGKEHQIIRVIERKTFGWGKDWDAIANTQFEELTGIPWKKVPRYIKPVLAMKIIRQRKYRVPDRRHRPQWTNGYSINPNLSEWLVPPEWGIPEDSQKLSGTPKTGSSGTPKTGLLVPPRLGNTKEKNKRKEQKKTLCPKYSEEHLGLASLLLNNIQKVCTVFNDSDLERAGGLGSWANTIRLMEEREGRRLADIRKIIEWLPGDEFWRNNILSAEALRKKFARLWGDMMDPKRPREKTAEELYEEEMRILKDPGR